MPMSSPASRCGWSRSRAALAAALLLLLPALAPRGAWADPAEDAQRLNKEANDLFAQKRYAEALTRFEAALYLLPDNAVLRKNVAEACGALGNQEAGASHWDEAAKEFGRAVSLAPDDARFVLWMGVVQEERGALKEAEASYRKAADLAPKDPQAPARLGRLLIRQNQLSDAATYLEKAAVLSPDDAELGRLLAQVKKDLSFEKGLVKTGVSDFDVAFDGTVNAEAAQRVLSVLLLAQTEVANDLGLSQKDKVRVILYTTQEYVDVTSAPEWAAAHFDGKIRLPIKDLDRREREIKATVYHEYTHAVLNDNLPHCPSWLHEGLAQGEEFGRVLGSSAEEERLRPLAGLKEGGWVPLAELEAPISGIRDPGKVGLAYAESLGFVRYLNRRFGGSTMQVFLTHWKEKPEKAYREVFREAYGYELEELEKDWHGGR